MLDLRSFTRFWIRLRLLRNVLKVSKDHSFSTSAKFSKKLTFLVLWYVKFCVRTKWIIPYESPLFSIKLWYYIYVGDYTTFLKKNVITEDFVQFSGIIRHCEKISYKWHWIKNKLFQINFYNISMLLLSITLAATELL